MISTSTGTSGAALKQAMAVPATARDPARGISRPSRSETPPTQFETTVSRPAATMKVPPITPAPAPSGCRRSGPSTVRVPDTTAGSAISHRAGTPKGRRSRSRVAALTVGPGVSGSSPGAPAGTVMRHVTPTRARATTARAQNSAARPTAEASAPMAGPATDPAMAADIA